MAIALALFLLLSFWLHFPAAPTLSPSFLLLAAACALSALVPDLDHEKSKGSSILFQVLCLAAVVLAASVALTSISPGALINFVLYSLVQLLVLFLLVKVLRPKHRGITHSLLALALFSATVFLISRSFALSAACGLGYLSHLLADFELKLA